MQKGEDGILGLKPNLGIGGTVLDAYNKAKEKTQKTRSAFRRVGYNYIYSLRSIKGG